MFIGHFAVGLGAKALRPGLSLGTYFLAVQFVDLLWPTLLALNLETVAIVPGITEMTPLDFTYYPYTHSLLMAFVWSAAAFVLLMYLRKGVSLSLTVAVCVFSHWVLDFFTHRPDLPLSFSPDVKVGLGLWNHTALTIVIETLMFALAVIIYARKSMARNAVGKYGFWSLIACLFLIHMANIFGPPPPNVSALVWAGHLQWLFVLWAYWVDSIRIAR